MPNYLPYVFFRTVQPSYRRAAQIVEDVYVHIDQIYDAATMGASFEMFRAISFCVDSQDRFNKTRAVLSSFKQTGSDAASIKADIRRFNELLDGCKIRTVKNNYTGGEISDAEHFCVAAFLSMNPLGFGTGFGLAALWDVVKPIIVCAFKHTHVKRIDTSQISLLKDVPVYDFTFSFNPFSADLAYDLKQFAGPDTAGVLYGLIYFWDNLDRIDPGGAIIHLFRGFYETGTFVFNPMYEMYLESDTYRFIYKHLTY